MVIVVGLYGFLHSYAVPSTKAETDDTDEVCQKIMKCNEHSKQSDDTAQHP